MSVTPNDYDFGAVHAAMRRYVDADILAGVSSAVLVGRNLVDLVSRWLMPTKMQNRRTD